LRTVQGGAKKAGVRGQAQPDSCGQLVGCFGLDIAKCAGFVVIAGDEFIAN
jgi:hypothetical protein